MPSDGPDQTLPVDDAGRIEALRSEFQRAFLSGPAPSLDAYLSQVAPELRSSAFRELLKTEIAVRRGRDEAVAIEEYLARYPDLHAPIRDAFEQADEQARRRGRLLGGLHVRCPHCNNPIELIPDSELDQIHCRSCGSRFTLAGDEGQVERDAAGVAQLGRFKLVERLGMGAFGTVWKAYDDALQRSVAVKIPRLRQLDRRQQERFLHEARSAAQLRHPNIVPVHEVGRDGQTLFIVSDFVPGVDLAKWLETQRPTPTDAAALCAQIARALHYAHDQGVIHRDLKPSNVMIDAAGQLHLMDFGLARREAGQMSMTAEGQIIGTPAYMSPEQAQGDSHNADRRSDVYSLGVLLFELLTAELPFRGNPSTMLQQVIHDEAPSPRKLNARVPSDLETLTLRCLEKDPNRRCQTALELADELDRFRHGLPILSRPITRAERVWRWCRRKPVVAGLTAAVTSLVLFVAIAGPIVAMRQAALRKSADENASEARQAQRESHVRLVRQYNANGRRLLDADDVFGALPWYVEALKENHDDPQEAAIDRLRLGLLLRHSPQLEQFWFHEGSVADAAFSPDGRLAAAACSDHTATIWNVETGDRQAPPLEHDDPVMKIRFSPDGQRLATVAGDRTGRRGAGSVRVWNAHTGAPVTPPLRHQPRDDKPVPPEDPEANPGYVVANTGVILDVAWSPDGAQLVTAADDKTARVWDVATGTQVGEPIKHDDKVVAASFGLNGSVILTADVGHAHIFEGTTHQSRWPPVAIDGYARGAALSVDGKSLLTVGHNAATVWNALSGQELISLKEEGWISSAEFNPEGARVIVARQRDGTARVADLAGAWQTPPLSQPRIERVGFFPDGLRAWTAGAGARVWDATTGAPCTPPLDVTHDLASPSPDGRRLATIAAGRGLALWDLAFDQAVVLPPWRDASSEAIFLSPDGARLARVASVDVPGQEAPRGKVQVWDVGESGPLADDLPHDLGVNFAVFSRDGSMVATCSGETYAYPPDDPDHPGEVRVWDAAHGAPITPPLAHPRTATCAAFSPNVRTLATGAADNRVRVWTMAEAKLSFPPLELGGPITSLAFDSQGGKLLATSDSGDLWSGQGQARVWNANTGQPITAPMSVPGTISKAWFSPNARRVVTQSSRMRGDTQHTLAQVWDAQNGLPLSEPIELRGALFEPTFSPDSRRMLVARGLYDLETGATLHQFDAPVLATIFDSQGGRVFTDDQRVRDATTGMALTPRLGTDHALVRAAFSPDGRLLATAQKQTDSANQSLFAVQIWNARTSEAVSQALPFDVEIAALSFSRDSRSLAVAGHDHRGTAMWRLDLSPDPRPAATIAALAFALSGHAIDAAGGYVDADVQAAWRRASASDPGAARPSAAADFHRRHAAQAEANYQPYAMRWHADRLASLEPQVPENFVRRGQADLMLKNWPAAVGSFTRAIELKAVNPVAWHGRGQAQAALGDWTRALRDLQRALELGSTDGEALLDLAIAQAETGAGDEARQTLQRQFAAYSEQLIEQQLGPRIVDLERGEHWAGAELLLGALLDLPELSGLSLPNADYSFDRTTALIHRGVMRQRLSRFEDALVDLSAALQEHPASIPVRRARGECYANLQRWREACDDYQAVIDASGDEPKVDDYYCRALVALGAGDREAYRRTCDAMLARWKDSTDADVTALVAWTCALTPEGPAADQLAVRAAGAAPDDAFVALALAAAQIRAARDDAVKLNDIRRRLESDLKADDARGPFDQLLLAMIYKRQGAAKQSDAYLQAANNPAGDNAPLPWEDQLEASLLRREVESIK